MTTQDKIKSFLAEQNTSSNPFQQKINTIIIQCGHFDGDIQDAIRANTFTDQEIASIKRASLLDEVLVNLLYLRDRNPSIWADVKDDEWFNKAYHDIVTEQHELSDDRYAKEFKFAELPIHTQHTLAKYWDITTRDFYFEDPIYISQKTGSVKFF